MNVEIAPPLDDIADLLPVIAPRSTFRLPSVDHHACSCNVLRQLEWE